MFNPTVNCTVARENVMTFEPVNLRIGPVLMSELFETARPLTNLRLNLICVRNHSPGTYRTTFPLALITTVASPPNDDGVRSRLTSHKPLVKLIETTLALGQFRLRTSCFATASASSFVIWRLSAQPASNNIKNRKSDRIDSPMCPNLIVHDARYFGRSGTL